MIKLIVKYDNNLCSFVELTGHANYAEYGKDIVCSGVSTCVFTSINLIDKLNHNCYKLQQDENKGFLRIDLDYQLCDNNDQRFISLIIQNLIDMCEEIKKDYPKNIKIEIL